MTFEHWVLHVARAGDNPRGDFIRDTREVLQPRGAGSKVCGTATESVEVRFDSQATDTLPSRGHVDRRNPGH